MNLNAIVYCEGAFKTTYGKTAHGLVRFTRRYRVTAVIDSSCSGLDSGMVLDGRENGIPILPDLESALSYSNQAGFPATHLVVGLALEGHVLPEELKTAALEALDARLNIDSGLHVFLSEIDELSRRAERAGVIIHDIRKPKHRGELHFFSGKIQEVQSFRVAILGTDSAIGKRTTAWRLVDELEKRKITAELVGTGQTAWMQGARYSLVLDSVVNDFVAGEIEYAVVSAWETERPEVILVEGQGSLMNPAFPGGYEILAAARPQAVIMQHAPRRLEYDGFPGFPLHPLPLQIQAVELISGRPVIAVSLNHEELTAEEIPAACASIEAETGLPCADPLFEGAAKLVDAILSAKKSLE